MIQLLELQAGPAPLRVQQVQEGGELASLRAEWGQLCDASDAALFCRWEWLYPWYRRLGGDRTARVLVARDAGGHVAGILPLCEEAARAFGGSVRRWGFLGDADVGSDGLDLICARGSEGALATVFSEWLEQRQEEWDVLELLDLPAGSPTIQALQHRFASSHQVEVVERFVCPWTALPQGETFDAFLRRTGRRDNFLRRRKWLQAQPRYRLERSAAPGELSAPMAEFFRLHEMRWQGSGGSDGIRGSRVEAFHRDAVELLAERGKVRLYTMWLGEQPVASVYGLVHRNEFIYFQAGYDPAFAGRSVGLVLVGETFRAAIDEGCSGYDFLRGTEAYKADWVSSARRTVAVRIVGKGAGERWARSQATRRTARAAIKRALPQQWVEAVRRRRRKSQSAQ